MLQVRAATQGRVTLWVVGFAAVASLAACDGGTASRGGDFYSRLNDGAECRELFEIRNELDPKDPEIPEMNDALRKIGCHSIDSKRTDR